MRKLYAEFDGKTYAVSLFDDPYSHVLRRLVEQPFLAGGFECWEPCDPSERNRVVAALRASLARKPGATHVPIREVA